MTAELTPQLWWYVARSSGLVAWGTATASIVWGLSLSSRLVRRRGIPAWLLDLHRFLGLLTVVFVGLHLLGLWADSYVYFGPRELFVPMASTWRPGAVAWGIVACYALVAIQVTSWMMRRLPRRLWHAVHLTSFLLFVAASVHAVQAGADKGNALVQWLGLAGVTAVVFLTLFRVLAPGRRRRSPRPVATAEATA